jgi:DNA polymerase-3 subunit epsilon
MRIFKQKERRDLASARLFYCNMEHEDAHSAQADVDATVDVFFAQLERYPDLKGMSTEQLSNYCKGEGNLDLAGKIALNEEGKAVYNFGKDKGKPIIENPGFAEWMLRNSFPENTKQVLRKILNA